MTAVISFDTTDLRAVLVTLLSREWRIAAGSIDCDRPLTEYGLDSITALTISGELEELLEYRIALHSAVGLPDGQCHCELSRRKSRWEAGRRHDHVALTRRPFSGPAAFGGYRPRTNSAGSGSFSRLTPIAAPIIWSSAPKSRRPAAISDGPGISWRR